MTCFLHRVILALCLASASVAVAQPHHGTTRDDALHSSGSDGDMAAARAAMFHHMGGQTFTAFLADRFEYVDGNGHEQLLWDVDAWHGGDLHKLWLKSEGEQGVDGGGTEGAELQVLYSRAVSPYFDLQAGIRHDFEPGPQRTYAVMGFQGLAPYWFEVDVAAFLSERGDLTASVEVEYELLLTQRLILQPRIELALAAQRVSEREMGRGVTEVEAGLRLRYEIRRALAPYVGVEWQRIVGDSRELARDAGEDLEDVVWVAGIRFWF
jgi:copper resistance protein B